MTARSWQGYVRSAWRLGEVAAAVATVDVLAELDRLIAEAAPEERCGLVVALSARLAALGAGMVALSAYAQKKDAKAAPATTWRLLTTHEAAALAGVTVRWLLRHTRGLHFRRDLSRKQARFEEQGFRRWLTTRA